MKSGTSPGGRGYAANAGANVASWFVSALAGFICVPIVVRGLGADAYGLLALVSAFTGYLGLMEMGLGDAIIRYVAYYRELDYGATVVAITRAAAAWFVAVGMVGAIALSALAPWLAETLKVPPDLEVTAITVIRLSSLNFLLGLLIGFTSSLFQAFLRYDTYGLIYAVLGTAASIGPAVLVSLGYGLVAVVVFSVALNGVGLAVYTFLAFGLYRGLNLHKGPPWREIRRPVLKFAVIAGSQSVHMVIAQQTSRVIVGLTGGTASAAYYQVPSMLSSNVQSMLGRAARVLFPTGAALIARGDVEGMRAMYYRTSRLFFLVNAAVNASMSAFAYPLVLYWVSAEFADQGSLALAIFAFTLMINGATMSASFLNLSAARPGSNSLFSLLNSAITLALLYPLTVRYGVPGAAAAALLGATTVPFFLIYTHRRILRVSSLAVLRRCYLPTITGSAVCAVLAYFLLVPLADSLLSTLALLALTMLLAVLLSGALGAISREDLATGRRYASAIVARFHRR